MSAFAAEELKEFQASYSDKFYLTETLAFEQGAELGHAEGRSSNNYFRPRGYDFVGSQSEDRYPRNGEYAGSRAG